MPTNDPPNTGSAAAELSAIAETLDRARDRVAAAAEPFLGTEREDVVSAVYEAERLVANAERAVRRAVKTLDR